MWLERNQLVAGTSEGEIYLVDNCELHQFIDNAFMTEESHPVVAMQKFSKGFFVASDHGEIAMYVRSEENNTSTGKNPYDWIRTCLPA